VWPLVYQKKDEATRALRDGYMQDVDYLWVRRDAQSSGGHGGMRYRDDYCLTTFCVEYFIVRRNREIFDVYRK